MKRMPKRVSDTIEVGGFLGKNCRVNFRITGPAPIIIPDLPD